ncbi:MAG: glutamate 5-kinase [Deltaproteobacteria bacterium]|nr:glutamate 5-kinase [Deltaproteobacteria bacterium]
MILASRSQIKKARRVVVKVGSSVLMKKSGGFSPVVFKNLARQIDALVRSGKEVVLVSSGAIAAGMQKLKIKKRPQLIRKKQALAALGQTALMHEYEKVFGRLKRKVAQVLLTREDLDDRRRFLNARQAISELLRLKAVPIINENDTVAVEEIQVGDNDNLSALVTNLVEADLLILLTDIDGVYTADPWLNKTARRVPIISNIDKTVHGFAGNTRAAKSTGGMITKLEAAEKAARFGVATVIAKGHGKNILKSILDGKDCGTFVQPKGRK